MLFKKKKSKIIESTDEVDLDESFDDEISVVPFKKRILKFIRNIIISFFVLAFLGLAAGLVYTWYVGKNNVVVEEEISAAVDSTQTLITPTVPDANAKVSASIQMLTSPVKPGSNATVTIKTNAKANCKITVVYKEVSSEDSGLYTKVADEYGVASWTWTVGSETPIGKWPVTITCANDSKSAVVIGNLVVATESTVGN